MADQQKSDGPEGVITAPAAPTKEKKGQQESRHYTLISTPTTDGKVMIGTSLQIFPNQERKDLASPGTRAYIAQDKQLPTEIFAILCGRSSIPRVSIISTYKKLKSKNILRLIDAGVINWTPEERQRLALIFEKPQGKKLQETPETPPRLISEDRLITGIIQPAIATLVEFNNTDLIHGAINPGNIYITGAEGLETIVLGDCLSSAASAWQHPAFEIASRASAMPAGRGAGTIKDDLHALAICVATMSLGKDLIRGRTPQQIIDEKLEHGSYMTMIGQERIPGKIAEFVRGVLNDDDNLRWNLEDVQQWLEGRRLKPKQSRVTLKAARPFSFIGRKYWYMKSLAAVFAENSNEAINEINGGQLKHWLQRNFDDKPLKEQFDRIWAMEKNTQPDTLLCTVCMALDHYGPVRYKNLALFPTGFSTALAIAMRNKDDLQPYAQMIAQQFFITWLGQRLEEIPNAIGLTTSFKKCMTTLTQKMSGYGIERVLYMMNPEVACMSPYLKDHCIFIAGVLLRALDDLARQADRPANILDRHMIAFISVRDPSMIDQNLGQINSPNKASQALGVLRTLAAIQRRFGIGPVPHLGNWIISLTPPIIEQLNDRDLRDLITKQVGKLMDKGELVDILDVVDDNAVLQEDGRRYAAARKEFSILSNEKTYIEEHLKKRKTFGRAMGKQIAMIVSSVLSIVIILVYILMRVMKVF